MIRVRFDEVGAAADDIRATAAQLETEIDSLNTYLRNTLSFWEGGANSEYWVSQTRWTTAGENIRTLLDNFAARLDSANAFFAGTERQIQETMRLS